MARAIVVSNQGRESRFGFSPIDRTKLYGSRKRLIVDEKGEPCTSGYLSVDGSVLLLADSRSMLYLDDASDVVERSTLRAVDAEKRPLEKLDSTLDVPQPLVGPVPPERVLDCNVLNVYQLAPETIDEELAAGLARGEIWETVYNYMAGYERFILFLLQNDQGVFGLVSELAEVEWMTKDAKPPLDDDFLSDEDDLDFSMF